MKDKQIRPNKNQVESVFSLYKNGQIKEALKDIKVLNCENIYTSFPSFFDEMNKLGLSMEKYG